MRPIQVLLLLLSGAGLVLYFTRLRSRLSDRIITALIVLLGGVMILLPDLTTVAANLVGVGRGVDLVIYLFLVGVGFLVLLFQSHLRVVDARIAELVRAVAIVSAQGPGESTPQERTGATSGD